MNPFVIRVEHLVKSYGPLKAVDDLSFSVPASACFGFLGPNGAGKTTLLRALYGMCRCEAGLETTVDVFGFNPRKHELEIKFLSGVVPQDNNLDEELNVFQNLWVYSKFYAMRNREARERIHSLLDFFELSEKRKAKIRELSGGMKRRLTIARALLHAPKLLILDEPTTGLDPQVRHLIWEKLRQLQKEGLTILITTHYMEEAYRLCDSVLIMDNGRKVLEGPPKDLLDAHIERFVLELRDSREVPAGRFQDVPLPEGVRYDASQDPPVFFSDDAGRLAKLPGIGKPGEYLIRPSNLEDLFLKLTGRALHEQQ
jgi:lipooligosaccharide transport system ATP-binding protein